MSRRHVVLFSFCALLLVSVLPSCPHAEVLFGPVTIQGGQTHVASFPMYCRCTAYFLEVRNQSSMIPRVLLNGVPVLEMTGEVWRKVVMQVELREDAPNEIEIRVGRTQDRAGVTVQVYEEDVTPSPMPAREYVKDSTTPEEYIEMFVLNHWASRFVLRVENGDPDGSHRVTSGTVRVNGQVVIGPEQLHGGVAEAEAEVELRSEGLNRIRTRVEGPAGAKIRLGIEEPAQTVTVTEVAEVPIVGAPRGCIGMRDGDVSVRLRYSDIVLDIGEDGQVDSLVTEGSGHRVMAMSRHGGYGVTRTGSLSGGGWAVHVYDPGWNQVATWEQRGDRIGAISDSGNTVVAFLSEEMPDEPPGPVVGYDIFDQAGTLLFTYPGAGEHLLYGDDLVVAPDGLTLAQFVPPVFRLWRRDGTVQWETEAGAAFAVGNGGVAIQSAGDSLLFYEPDGGVSRIYAGNEPKSRGSAEAAMPPQGQVGMHLGVGIMVGRRDGPQSCWRFTAPAPGWVGVAWMSDDGRWAFGASQGIYGPNAQQGAWLIGAGGETMWDTLLEGGMAPLCLTAFTEDGGYFFYTEHLLPAGDRCRLFRIDIADRGR